MSEKDGLDEGLFIIGAQITRDLTLNNMLAIVSYALPGSKVELIIDNVSRFVHCSQSETSASCSIVSLCICPRLLPNEPAKYSSNGTHAA